MYPWRKETSRWEDLEKEMQNFHIYKIRSLNNYYRKLARQLLFFVYKLLICIKLITNSNFMEKILISPE